MMSPVDSVRTCFRKYATISGRAARSEYWWFVLFTVIVGGVLSLVDGAIFGFGEGRTSIVEPLWALATLLPSICVAGRRLHDYGLSAWWLLIALVPFLGLLFLVVVFVQRGTSGENAFGSDPLAAPPE